MYTQIPCWGDFESLMNPVTKFQKVQGDLSNLCDFHFSGGAFEFVSCANYFGETLEWWGYCIACWSPPAMVFAILTTCVLGTRALSHHKYVLCSVCYGFHLWFCIYAKILLGEDGRLSERSKSIYPIYLLVCKTKTFVSGEKNLCIAFYHVVNINFCDKFTNLFWKELLILSKDFNAHLHPDILSSAWHVKGYVDALPYVNYFIRYESVVCLLY